MPRWFSRPLCCGTQFSVVVVLAAVMVTGLVVCRKRAHPSMSEVPAVSSTHSDQTQSSEFANNTNPQSDEIYQPQPEVDNADRLEAASEPILQNPQQNTEPIGNAVPSNIGRNPQPERDDVVERAIVFNVGPCSDRHKYVHPRDKLPKHFRKKPKHKAAGKTRGVPSQPREPAKREYFQNPFPKTHPADALPLSECPTSTEQPHLPNSGALPEPITNETKSEPPSSSTTPQQSKPEPLFTIPFPATHPAEGLLIPESADSPEQPNWRNSGELSESIATETDSVSRASKLRRIGVGTSERSGRLEQDGASSGVQGIQSDIAAE